MIGRRSVDRLLLQAARHAVMQARGVGQQLRMDAAADHRGELVVRGAEVGPEKAADVRGVALQGGMVLMQARMMMMVHQRV